MAITNARILIRGGNEADFDPDKMQPREWALSTDKKIVRICVAPGVCIRMATYEAFEADMAKIEAILAECRDIQTVVNRINDEVSANAKAVAEYTEQAKQYRDEAEQFRNEAETFTPEGYSELVQNVEENTVKIDTILEKGGLTFDESASGENIHRTDTTDNKVTAFALYGKATQDGTPTPDAPVEIEVSGASGSVEVKSVGKNLLKNTATSQTINGVTFTVNEDGSVTADGTATATCQLYYDFTANISVNDLILSGCPSGGTFSNYWLTLSDRTEPKNYIDYGNGVECSLVKGHTYRVVFVIYNGQTISNFKFYPMIRFASDPDDTYEPYKETTATIPTPNGLPGIPVSSNGNYTDGNGQQWVCDEIIKYADGTGKYVQRIGKEIFDGSDDEAWNYQNTNVDSKKRNYTEKFSEIISKKASVSTKSNILCTHYISVPHGSSGTHGCNVGISVSDAGRITIYDDNFNTTDILLWISHLAENPITVLFELAEPITTPLTAEEIAEIEKLQTFYPVTNISNDAECYMEVAYKADAKNYIDNIILARVATLETAVINNL